MMEILELTKENENLYLDQIAKLENLVLELMNKEGREGQFFATGKENISKYVNSDENTVLVAVDETGRVGATTYVTQGQESFTYNDITKYFKCSEKYKQYVKEQYSDQEEYKKDLLRIYTIKINAFEYAKRKILKEYPEINDIQSFLQKEVEKSGFDEKSELREKVNKYMSEYISQNFGTKILEKYEQFFWTTIDDIFNETGRKCKKDVNEYESILENQKLTIYEEPDFEESLYYTANPRNAIELDTYITMPNSRNSGIARILIYEGLKKHMDKHFSNPENNEIFICSTLHRENLPSKYVSEFFGLTDSLYVKRRQGRNREVHICKIGREEAMEYLTSISDKLAVLYGYNPNKKHISKSTKIKVLEEQLNYEEKEEYRLVTAHATGRKFSGANLRFIKGKGQKIKELKQQIKEMKQANKGEY